MGEVSLNGERERECVCVCVHPQCVYLREVVAGSPKPKRRKLRRGDLGVQTEKRGLRWEWGSGWG